MDFNAEFLISFAKRLHPLIKLNNDFGDGFQ